jgi:peptidoglycan/LPS O-acetylase OafA/YrhL
MGGRTSSPRGTIARVLEGTRAAAPPPFEPPPGNPRFPLFDGLRAIAALGVLFGHCASITFLDLESSGGEAIADMQIGVTIFFVISGFLLYRPFVSADMQGHEHPPTLVFYARRALRIFPGYWFALTLIGLLPAVVGVLNEGDWWRYYLLLQNYEGGEAVFARGIGPAWSLSVELAFYATLPLFAVAMSRLGGSDPTRRMVRDLAALGVLALVSAGTRALVVGDLNAANGEGDHWYWNLTLTLPLFLAWFAVGMAFATVSSWSSATGRTPGPIRTASRNPTAVWGAALWLYALLVLTTDPLNRIEDEPHHLLAILVAGLIVFPAAFPHPSGRGVPAKVLALPLVAWLGLISYGIFLWAGPVTVALFYEVALDFGEPFWVLAPLAFAASVAAGAFSYYVVERPFLRLKNRQGKPPPAEPKAGQTTSRSSPVPTS